MKKKLVIIFLGILITLSIIYLLRFKRSLVFEELVPNSATEIIHINLRQIEHHILVDAIKNPLKYIDFKLPAWKKDSLKLKKTISIPRNILFYTNDNKLNDIWLSSFIKVKRLEKLSDYLIRDGFMKSNVEEIMLFSKHNLVLAIKDKRLVVAFKKKNQAIFSGVANEIFIEDSFLSKTSDVLKPIITSKSDISYNTLTNDFVEANFKNGLFEVLGRLNSDLFLAGKQCDFSKNSLGFINTKINKEHELFQTLIAEENSRKFNDFTKLSLDSIISKWNGSFAFNLKSINSKTDTILTYDYDDDFNKIEKVATQELTVPDIDFSLDDETKLFSYFSKENAIQVFEIDTLFTSIPLYKLYANSTAGALNISSQKEFSGFSLKKNKIKLNAYFNIEKYMQKPLEFSFIPIKNSYLQLIKDASVQLSNKNELSVKVNLKNTKRNFIGQFIKP